jgi:Ca2+-binding RTX toxin-like protein
MATITARLNPFFAGFSTDTFFIPGRPATAAFDFVLSGGGTSVVLDYADLGLRFTYGGTNLTVFAGLPAAGAIRSITVAQYDSSDQNFYTIGTLTLPIKTSWNFADLFTGAYATAYAAGGHSITGTTAADTLIGGALADVFVGRSHNDIIRGNAGDDVIVLSSQGAANELPATATLTAQMGAGSDTLRYDNTGGSLNLRGAAMSGIERIDLTGAGILHLDAHALSAGLATSLAVNSQGGTLQFWQTAGQPFSVATLQVTGNLIVAVVGGAGNDIQLGNAASRERLSGGDGNDWLRGLGGQDTLSGDAGNDTLDGGTGADTLTGGTGDDLYIVNGQDDVIEAAGGGTDTVRVYTDHALGNHVEHAMSYVDTGLRISGNDLGNQIGGGLGDDSLSGAGGDDIMSAVGGEDRMTGGSGDDILNAGAGNDVIRGDAGNDRLIGNRGGDTVTGGEGADVFVFRTNDGADRIRDFATNGDVQDIIDLSEWSAITGWADLRANHMVQSGLNVVISANGGDTLVLERVWMELLSSRDFQF